MIHSPPFDVKFLCQHTGEEEILFVDFLYLKNNVLTRLEILLVAAFSMQNNIT